MLILKHDMFHENTVYKFYALGEVDINHVVLTKMMLQIEMECSFQISNSIPGKTTIFSALISCAIS